MTMLHESHPHDERLAALAGADREATEDRVLRDHIAGCDRCRAVVDDLALLRSALAELPDLRPSRPLQLLPPVAAPAPRRGGLLGRLRGISAPALAAGAVLILVGAVGSSGMVENLTGGAAGSASYADSAQPRELAEGAEPTDQRGTPGILDSGGSPAAAASSPKGDHQPGAGASSSEGASLGATPTRQGDDSAVLRVTSDPLNGRLAWLVVLGVGVALAVGSLLLRFTVQPRAS
jgi:hypothetical protein